MPPKSQSHLKSFAHLSEIAGWVDVSHDLANMWLEEKSQPIQRIVRA